VNELTINSRLRKERLRENWSRLQFYWRCEVVETWIIRKEEVLRASANIEVYNLASIKQLIAKHETFSSNLDAFEIEGIRPIIDLK
jgi:hypothetical protein